MYDAIYKSLFQYRLQQPEVFEIVLHPDNLNFIKSGAESLLGFEITELQFQQLSIELNTLLLQQGLDAFSQKLLKSTIYTQHALLTAEKAKAKNVIMK